VKKTKTIHAKNKGKKKTGMDTYYDSDGRKTNVEKKQDMCFAFRFMKNKIETP
jgi:hypothetical protein